MDLKKQTLQQWAQKNKKTYIEDKPESWAKSIKNPKQGEPRQHAVKIARCIRGDSPQY